MADRDNIQQAWEIALENGLAKALADMARGLAVISFAQGLKPSAMLEEANRALQERGIPETDWARLTLRLVELSTRRELDDQEYIYRTVLGFLPLLEAGNDLELLYWGYDCMSFFNLVENDMQALHWHEKAYQVALRLENDHLSKRTQALSLWLLTDSAIPDEGDLAQLQSLLGQARLEQLQGYYAILNQITPKALSFWDFCCP